MCSHKRYSLTDKRYILKVAITYISSKNSSHRMLREKYNISEYRVCKILNVDLKNISPLLYNQARKVSVRNKERSYNNLDLYRHKSKKKSSEQLKLEDMRINKG